MGLFGRKDAVYSKLSDRFIDSEGKEWVSQYRYDTIELQTVVFKKKNYAVNQSVNLRIAKESNNMCELNSVEVVANDVIIGYISSIGQRRMIRDYIQKQEHLVLAQISELTFSRTSLRILYYKSSVLLQRQADQYANEKAAYKRMEPRSFTTTLIGNKSEQMQFELSHGKLGMKVECNEDDERYLIETQDSWQLGYLPKKVSNEIDKLIDLGYEIHSSEIVNIVDEQGKTNVEITINLLDRNYK